MRDLSSKPSPDVDCSNGAAGMLAAKAEQAKLDGIENAKREAKRMKAKEKNKACKVLCIIHWHVSYNRLTFR